MRITCPYCGDRPADEYAAAGAADPTRPEASADLAQWVDYVYLRDNPAGRHRELFQHVGGCRSWLAVVRDTRTHQVLEVQPAREAGLARRSASGDGKA